MRRLIAVSTPSFSPKCFKKMFQIDILVWAFSLSSIIVVTKGGLNR